MSYTGVKTHSCREAADYLQGAFSWSSSPEGMVFWQKIHERLRDLSHGQLPDKPCVTSQSNEQIADLQEIINNQLTKIITLQKKLRASEFVNMGRTSDGIL